MNLHAPADFYFAPYEGRRPPPPTPFDPVRETVWQVLAIAAIALGAWYLHWRWTASLNTDALWFAIPAAAAETLAWIGLVLFVHNLWSDPPVRVPPPPRCRTDCLDDDKPGPVTVDIFITTYDEEPELVRLSIRDALDIRVPPGVEATVHVLDDGARAEMGHVARQEGAHHITRIGNAGYKAGNLRHAMEVTSGDFIVICDADTRLFPGFLENTLGHFRDPDMAWVQTPQWFYDIPQGTRLPLWLSRRLGRAGRCAGLAAERLIGPVRLGADPFANCPRLFSDVIQRPRNAVHASFCCGAASIHRRDAIV